MRVALYCDHISWAIGLEQGQAVRIAEIVSEGLQPLAPGSPAAQPSLAQIVHCPVKSKLMSLI